MRSNGRRWLLLCAALSACAPSAWETARRQDSAEAWARFLREEPSSPLAPQARQRLAELEFQEARRQNTILAYKRFLAGFPQSERRRDAEILLENLRFAAAAERDTPVDWLEFLRDHPAGSHLGEARARLEQADWRAAVAAGTAKAVEGFLARHPSSPHRAEAERLMDDRWWEEARAAGPAAIAAYLERGEAGAHREEARGALAEREALARASLGEMEAARRAAERVSDPAARERTLAAIERAELDLVSARLDPKALLAFAASRAGPVAEEAKARARALAREGAALKELADRLSPSHWARPADELVRVLAAEDPRERWLAAEELGRMGARSAAEALLDAAATSRFSRVRSRAFAALKALYAPMPPDVREVDLRGRLEGLRKVAASPALRVKLAVLEELLGEHGAALASYQKSMRGDSSDLFALRRVLELKGARREVFGTAVAARALSSRVHELVELRGREEGLSPLLLARTLCGARDEAQAALAALEGLAPEAARDFPEDLQQFRQRASDTLRLASARLGDAEAEARAAGGTFRGCDDDGGMRERLAEGEARRVQAVAELARRPGEAVRQALALAARSDPAAAVREAARAAQGAVAGRREEAGGGEAKK